MGCLGLTVLALSGKSLVAEPKSYSPYATKTLPMQLLWGDTHLHTSYSPDAFTMGNRTLTPEDAYRFASGKAVTAINGMTAILNRPLDFLVVSDHAEYLGLLPALQNGEPAALAMDSGKRWHDMLEAGGDAAWDAMIEIIYSFGEGKSLPGSEKVQVSIWEQTNAFAEAANKPGQFSAFAGFEWTSMPNGDNLHRVVIFRDGASKTTRVAPFSALDSQNPEDLWHYLANYEKKTGGDVIAIPHNGNGSNGRMFSKTTFRGKPIDPGYAQRRQRWEPVMEVTQIKGDGETHPLLSPNDEFADYGTWDDANLAGTRPKEPWMLQYEYARSALRLGLELSDKTGVNPYQFGMIGSTDAHTALATAEENNFWGKSGLHDPSPERTRGGFAEELGGESPVKNWEQVAAGYAAVWATENSRAAIFDALRRREVYATTGPRMTVRFFGGWQLRPEDVTRPDYAVIGYDKGVPMGGSLPPAPANSPAPHFMIVAMKDAMGANLDRVQVVKGWLDAGGETHEKVYDVSWSGEREPGPDGRLPPVGNTVDPDNAIYGNTIGATQLATVWADPDFDPQQRAFYYVRVLEIPTPRWVLYDKVRLGADIPAEAERIHQERAYTSPIWYTPQNSAND